jgi:very-short-patch-repair endonuclease
VLVDSSLPASWRQQLAVATLACNSAGVAGFQSAALLHGMDGRWGEPIVLLAAAPRRIMVDRARLHVGPMDPCDLTVVDGIRCTTVERTLCDLGSAMPELDVRIAFEWFWRSGGDLTTLQRTVDRLHRPGQHGTKVVQELLVEARLKGRPTESALEARLEAILDEIEGLVRQFEVYAEDGSFIARVDLAIPTHRLAIEAHSRQFHSSPAARVRDERRHGHLTAAGWRVRYVTNAELADPCKLRSTIRVLLRSDDSPAVPRFPDLS